MYRTSRRHWKMRINNAPSYVNFATERKFDSDYCLPRDILADTAKFPARKIPTVSRRNFPINLCVAYASVAISRYNMELKEARETHLNNAALSERAALRAFQKFHANYAQVRA